MPDKLCHCSRCMQSCEFPGQTLCQRAGATPACPPPPGSRSACECLLTTGSTSVWGACGSSPAGTGPGCLALQRCPPRSEPEQQWRQQHRRHQHEAASTGSSQHQAPALVTKLGTAPYLSRQSSPGFQKCSSEVPLTSLLGFLPCLPTCLTWTVSVVPSCLGTMRVVMVNMASFADRVPARMPHVSIPRLVLLMAYLQHRCYAGLSDEHSCSWQQLSVFG